MSAIRIYSPEGDVGRDETTLTTIPSSLAGLRIRVLDNGKPGAASLLAQLAEGLAARTGAVFAGVSTKGSAATPCEEALLSALVSDADLVLTGTAD